MLNFYRVAGWATSGQPSREQFSAIAAAGYTAVINLALPTSDNALPDEDSLVRALGMQYHAIPVPFDAPDKNHFQAFVLLMDTLPSGTTWVHCALNARVSAFMFKYLHDMCGLPESRASTPLLTQWRPQMDEVWRRFMAMDCANIAAVRNEPVRSAEE